MPTQGTPEYFGAKASVFGTVEEEESGNGWKGVLPKNF